MRSMRGGFLPPRNRYVRRYIRSLYGFVNEFITSMQSYASHTNGQGHIRLGKCLLQVIAGAQAQAQAQAQAKALTALVFDGWRKTVMECVKGSST
jgi:hypothetical protein